MDSITSLLNQGTPWIWYLTRMTGMLAYILLWFSIFLGLAVRNPLLKRVIAPATSFSLHSFVAATATFWAFIHATSLLFDKAFPLTFMDIFIPYYSKTTLLDPLYLALGIMAFYGMIIVTLTSYLRKNMNHKLWRVIHFLNPIIFVFVVVHGLVNGTDLNNVYAAGLYLTTAGLLVLLYLSTLAYRIIGRKSKGKPAAL